MDWLKLSLSWYFLVFTLGLIFFPLTKKLFNRFIDKGYAFSKTLAILTISYIVFLLGSFHISVFNSFFAAGISSLILFGSILFLKPNSNDSNHLTKKLIIFEEILFIFSFLFLTYIRGQQPAINGLEKFMDFGIINSILRSNFFPPLDIWLSADRINPEGYFINYYYFGHLTSALLIKLSNIKASIGYNLSLATIFAVSMISIFSICINLVSYFKEKVLKIKKLVLFPLVMYGLLGSFIVNLGGNLHTIYLFTSGYPNDSPIPFWKILSIFSPEKYWYPNATRFIPYTIHEFPSYSYTVADLHGHVLDIPFVLLTIAFLFLLFFVIKKSEKLLKNIFYFVFAGFMIAILYMTNAFDGPIYLVLTLSIYLTLFGFSSRFLSASIITITSAFMFALPFISKFNSFVSKIGINCPPKFLSNIEGLGPFLFEAQNCQMSPAWMLFVLWGFFITSFAIFIYIKLKNRSNSTLLLKNKADDFVLLLMLISTVFILIPEFFYVKDIYPAHFRANTMFKLGYQAYIMMGIASLFVFFRLGLLKKAKKPLKLLFVFMLFFILIYPFFSFSSYYHPLNKKVELDGSLWLNSEHPEDQQIINFFNKNIDQQPVILEAQGDSYTDFARISSYTGLPTVAGWWIHEWLWRGSSNVIGERIPDIEILYQSKNLQKTQELINKYHIEYIVVSELERSKYKNLYEEKFSLIGTKIFETSNGNGAIYKLKLDNT